MLSRWSCPRVSRGYFQHEAAARFAWSLVQELSLPVMRFGFGLVFRFWVFARRSAKSARRHNDRWVY